MNSIFSLLAPELTLTVGASLILLLGLSHSPAKRWLTGWVALITVFIALLITWYASLADAPVSVAGLRLTNLTWFIRLVALGIGLLVVLIHWPLATGPSEHERGDIFAMILFSLTGILLTSVADDLVLLFLAIELVSVPTYVLVSIGRSDIRAQEAGLKYFFLGALSAALLVYGFSFLYGASGTTLMSRMILSSQGAYATIGLLLAFAGISFKIAAVPFHVYAADVYQGAASPVTGLLGFFPKVAGFVALIKLFLIVQPQAPLAMGWDLPQSAFLFLWLVAAVTMTVGNVLGLMQSNVKRILAYSSIAHSGYMLIGALVGPVSTGGALADGLSAMLFYIVIYGVMNLGAFAVLSMIQVRGRAAEELNDLSGLARRQPLAALAMAVCLFSLMGMPPTAGFFGKVYIFSSALSAGPGHPHQKALIVLAIIGVLNAAIAAAYYLRIIAACYLSDEEAESTTVPHSNGVRWALVACCMMILFIGVWPEGLIRMARQPFYHLQPTNTMVLKTSPPSPG